MSNRATRLVRRAAGLYAGASQLKRNLFSNFVYSGTVNVLSLLVLPVYLHFLGAETYGLWVTAAVILEFSQVGQFGLDTALVKYTAEAYGKQDYREITGYISTAMAVLLVPFAVGLTAVMVFRAQLGSLIRLKPEHWDEGLRLIVAVGVLSGLSFFVQVLRGAVVGIGRLDFTNYTFLVSRIVRIAVAVVLLVLGWGVWSLFTAWLVYFSLPVAVWALYLGVRRRIRVFDPFAIGADKLRRLLRFGGTLFLAQLAHIFIVPFNKVIIARYVGLAEVTYYQIAFQLVMTVRGVFVQGLESLLPRFSEAYRKTRESLAEVLDVRRKGLVYVWALAVPLFAFLALAADPLLKIWLGGSFDPRIALTVQILSLGWLVNALSVPDYFFFIGIGRPGASVAATCLKSVSNVALVAGLLAARPALTLVRVATVDAVSLAVAVLFLTYKAWAFRREMAAASLLPRGNGTRRGHVAEDGRNPASP